MTLIYTNGGLTRKRTFGGWSYEQIANYARSALPAATIWHIE